MSVATRLSIILLLLYPLLSDAKEPWETDHKLGCKTNPDLVGPCVSIRGRLNAWNGSPSTRIWPVGTKRLLGLIWEEDGLPANLKGLIHGNNSIYADLLICPLSKQKPGRMQSVCVEEAKNVLVREP